MWMFVTAFVAIVCVAAFAHRGPKNRTILHVDRATDHARHQEAA